jgi:D-alanyl-D-alanine carboxypeptidase (penicillin-binding protein 5/6)
MQKLLKKRSGSRLSRVKTRRLATALLVLFVLYIGWAFVAVPTSAFAGTEVSLPASTSQASTASVAWPGAKEAAVGTAEYGTLASNGAQTPVPIASVAKVMIALAILRERPFDKGEQGDMLTLTQQDVDLYNSYVAKDGSVARVAVGEQISEYQALQALMLPSANNIADTLAIWAFGSVDAYTDYANSYANTLGMKSTHFADASGYDPATVSSAVDLVKLGQRAMQNAVISDIVSQETATIPVAGTIRNVNRLLDDGDGFVGIKTGNTDQAGGCLLFAAIYPKGDQTVTIIGAVLGSSDLTQALRDSSGLLASAKGNFVESTAIKKGTVVGTYALPWGERVSARSDNDINALTWRGTNVTTQIALSSVHVPATSGQDVGKVVERGSSVGSSKTVPITLNQAIEGPSLWWRVMHPVDTWHFRFG